MSQHLTRSEARQKTVTLRRASERERDALISVLMRAFDSDPLLGYMLRQDQLRSQARRTFFDRALRIVLARGEVWTTDCLAGASLFLPPGRWRFGIWTELLSASSMLRATSCARALRSLRAFRVIKRAHPEAPHYYLFLLGVEPARQGCGVGASLLAPLFARCTSEQLPAYLENSNQDNRRFYEGQGFRVTRMLELGEDAPPVDPMWRDATNARTP